MKRFLSKSLISASLVALGLFASSAAIAQANCSVNYKITNSWGNGGQADVTLTNLGSAKTSWELCWTFNGNESINNLWNGSRTQNGKSVCVRNAGYNGNLPTNGSTGFGFTHTNAPGAIPTNFTLNGAVCGGTSSQPATSSSRSSNSVSSQPPISTPSTSTSRNSSSSSRSSSSAPTVAARWLINDAKSLLNFVSVKNRDVAETFTFSQLQGTISTSGQATLTIPLASISTGVDLRNTRMRQMLFEADILPSLHFTTQLDLAAIDAMAEGSTASSLLTGNLILHGKSKAISFDALLIKHSTTSFSVSPRKPIVISSTDFDLDAGIEALRSAVGASTIGGRVPVYFKMFLTRDNPGNLPAITLAPAPSAPLSLMGTMNNFTAIASLNWTDTSTTETGFLIRRNDINGRWVSVGRVPANAGSFTNSVNDAAGAADFKSVTYKVIAVTDSIPSDDSATLPLTYVYQFDRTSASSVSSPSSRSSSSSSQPQLVGDATRGKALWENPGVGCLFCHAVNADGTAGTSLSKIDPRNLRYTTAANLVKYIEDNMPKSDPAACVGQCAADTAAYFLSIKPATSSSSSSNSSRSSSSVSSIGNLTGEQLYTQKGCANCHGARGDNAMRPIVVERWTRASLITKIDTSMPLNDPSSCVGDCATKIADFILSWKPPVVCTSGEDVLPRRLRLLTNREYANTVNDLLGVSSGATLAANFEPDSKVKGFDNNATAGKVGNGRMDAYWNAAKDVSGSVNLANLMNCTTSTPRDQCANTFVPAFGKRAFRRPLTSAEQTSYISLFRLGASNDAGARLVIQGMLSSPNFLYRSEIGTTLSGTGSLSAYETATLLAYTFTGSMPDATLFTEADNNRLSTPAQLRTQAERLLGTTKAGPQFAHFGMQWLHVDDVANLQRDRTLYPQFNSTVGTAMKTELETFIKEIFLKPGYKIADVFSPGFTYLNGSLASYYGISGVSGDQFQKVTTDARRGGVLHMGAINTTLASVKESHPIHRGLLVRRNLLCQEFAPPPPNVGEVEPLDPNKPTRQRFAAHTNNENCQSCHQYIDNIGFGFENYDAVGRFRTVEGNNIPVDASGNISGLAVMTETDNYQFSDLRGLSNVLATSGAEATSKCVTRQYQRFAMGVSEPNQCAVDASYSRWQGKSTDLRDMMLETVTSPSYLNRK